MAFTLILLICSLGCAGYSIGPPSVPPSQPNVISLDPRDWYILYSAGMAAHPSPNAAGVWSFPFPSAGHVNYIQTPFTAATIPHSVSLTFRVDSTAPQYEVIDPNDVLPATATFSSSSRTTISATLTGAGGLTQASIISARRTTRPSR